jgi:hypothetical protein
MVLGPILKLINGPTVADALADPASELNQLVANQPDDAKLLEEVFVRFLARKPHATELQLGLEALQAAAADQVKAKAALAEYEKQLPAKQAAWEASLGKPVVWQPLDATELKSAAGATLTKQEDKSIVATGNLAKDVYTLFARPDINGITGFKLEALTDASLAAGGPGRAQNGNFVVSEFKVTIDGNPVELAASSSDFHQEGWHVSGAIDGNEETGWAVSPEFGKNHEAIFETKADAAIGTVAITISQQYVDGKHCLGKFRLSVTDGTRPLTKAKLPALVATAIAVPKEQRTAEQTAAIAAHFQSLDAELARLSADVQKSAEQAKSARAIGVQDLAWALINNPAFLFNR